MSGLDLNLTATGTRFPIRAVPRSSRSALDGVRDGRLVVRVTAPPVGQAANDAIVRTLATALDVPRRLIAIVAGGTGRNKTIEISGLGPADVRARLAAAARQT